MKVTWSELARSDLAELRGYIARDRPSAAQRIASRIVWASRLLARYPRLGRAGVLLHTRELPVAGTPYILVYRLAGDAIEILRVLHGAQE